jgi:hypothetical protein
MNRKASLRLTALCAISATALVLGSCDSGPRAGDLTASLTTSHQELGAAMFRVTATAPYTIEGLTGACNGCRAFLSRVSEGEVRGIVTGPFGAGQLVHVTVSDTRTPAAYGIQLLELARPDYGLAALSGSSLQFPAQQ